MNQVTLMDCTLRDGGNIVGKGFSEEITTLVLDGLTSCHVPIIELGNSGGIGAYEVAGFTDALTDLEYLDIASKYYGRGSELGMFLNAKRYLEKNVDLAAEHGLSFLRIGTDAGDCTIALQPVKDMKKRHLKAYYSAMKAYLLSPEDLAEEAKRLEDAGLDMFTIMDSAGTMLPDQVAVYTETLCKAVAIPIAFHGHNNLGLSAANALAAYQNGASVLDCGLMGMARSAGNLATENCVAMMQRYGQMMDIDLYGMLNFIETKLEPAMKKHDYHNPITPLDLTLGFSGCHSSFLKTFKKVAKESEVDLFRLVTEVSAINQKNPSETLISEIAEKLK